MRKFFFEIKKSKTVGQLYRFGLVGIASNLFGYALYLLLTYCGVTPKLTVSILYPIGTIIGFFSSQKWVFESEARPFVAGMRYLLVQLFGYIINIIILIMLVDRLAYPHQIAQLSAIFIVAIFVFTALRIFVFNQSVLNQRKI